MSRNRGPVAAAILLILTGCSDGYQEIIGTRTSHLFVRGTAVDGETGTAVPNTSVFITAHDETCEDPRLIREYSDETDGDGRFQVLLEFGLVLVNETAGCIGFSVGAPGSPRIPVLEAGPVRVRPSNLPPDTLEVVLELPS